MPYVLVPLTGGRPIPLDKAIVFFGRGQECDVVLTASRKISRKHCCVAQIDDRYVVRDLGSMNGVRVNGKLIPQEAGLSLGDELCIGDQLFRVEAVGVKPKSPRNPPAVDPHMISGDIPVILPDEAEDFAVEVTGARHIPLAQPVDDDEDWDVEEIDDDDVIDD
ncbi:MAG: FHA domain-containing protein [Planctomycetaceae bacterium]|nr:FHA domain-containing protein [Planctomycetaceae bacterium]